MGPKARAELERAITLTFLGRSNEALAKARRISSDSARWIEAYAAGARGDFALACALAEPVASGARARTVRALASITAGSAWRQSGRYREAMPHDRRALTLARSAPERTHALLGLAADAIGLGFVSQCGRRLAEATLTAPGDDWRCQVRLGWVRTELALALGRPDAAVASARRALRRATDAGAPRHVAKSNLFLGAALRDAGNVSMSRQHLGLALRRARACGAMAISRVARNMLADRGVHTAG